MIPSGCEDFDGDTVPDYLDLDTDNDGIIDKLDKCPFEEEDLDGYMDEDGCPDLDNDGDFNDATGKNIKASWKEPGVHWVSVKTKQDDKEIIKKKII